MKDINLLRCIYECGIWLSLYQLDKAANKPEHMVLFDIGAWQHYARQIKFRYY